VASRPSCAKISHRASICAIAAWTAAGALRAITNGALATKKNFAAIRLGYRPATIVDSKLFRCKHGLAPRQGFASGGGKTHHPNPKRPPARLVASFAHTSACTQSADFCHAQRLRAGPRGHKPAMPRQHPSLTGAFRFRQLRKTIRRQRSSRWIGRPCWKSRTRDALLLGKVQFFLDSLIFSFTPAVGLE
jgi:hypothetical protein